MLQSPCLLYNFCVELEYLDRNLQKVLELVEQFSKKQTVLFTPPGKAGKGSKNLWGKYINMYCPPLIGLKVPWNFVTIYSRLRDQLAQQFKNRRRSKRRYIKYREATQNGWYLLRKPAIIRYGAVKQSVNCYRIPTTINIWLCLNLQWKCRGTFAISGAPLAAIGHCRLQVYQ